MRSRYRFEQFKKHNPEKFNTLVYQIISDLSELEKAVSSSEIRRREINHRVKVKIRKSFLKGIVA